MSEDLKKERTCALDLGTKGPGRRVQEEGNASAKVPEVDVFLEYSRNGKAASVTEAEQMREVLRK